MTRIINCRNPNNCPLKNNCLTSSVVYLSTISTLENPNIQKFYIGSTMRPFKERWLGHMQSFNNRNYKYMTDARPLVGGILQSRHHLGHRLKSCWVLVPTCRTRLASNAWSPKQLLWSRFNLPTLWFDLRLTRSIKRRAVVPAESGSRWYCTINVDKKNKSTNNNFKASDWLGIVINFMSVCWVTGVRLSFSPSLKKCGL